jgi:hypothetical protein
MEDQVYNTLLKDDVEVQYRVKRSGIPK